jgi:proteic killer suppression protein
MICGFACAKTRRFFETEDCPPEWCNLARALARKLDLLDAATSIADLRAPYGNHLEALKKDRRGQHSIRVNDQWRVCFVWTERGPDEVEFIDYH